MRVGEREKTVTVDIFILPLLINFSFQNTEISVDSEHQIFNLQLLDPTLWSFSSVDATLQFKWNSLKCLDNQHETSTEIIIQSIKVGHFKEFHLSPLWKYSLRRTQMCALELSQLCLRSQDDNQG